MKRTLFLVAALAMASTQMQAQTLYLKAGAHALATDQTEAGKIGDQVRSLGFVGGKLWLNRSVEAFAGIGLVGQLNAEVGVNVYPTSGNGQIEPYIFTAIGSPFTSDVLEEYTQLGLGAKYALSSTIDLGIEIAKRDQVRNEFEGLYTGVKGMTYALTVNYKLNDNRPGVVTTQRVVQAPQAVAAAPVMVRNETGASVSLTSYDDMVLVPDGLFILGLTDEDPLYLQTAGLRRVTISSFFIDRYEVTNAEYRDYLATLSEQEREDALPDSTSWEREGARISFNEYFYSNRFDDYPVVGVNWNEASAYCEAKERRLPTEAEWEYAARSGEQGDIYPWKGYSTRDSQGDFRANFNPGREGYAVDGYSFTAPVDAFEANRWGLYNISGNAAEWTADAYSPNFLQLADFNPVVKSDEPTDRVVRGGSWRSDAFFIGLGVRDTQNEVDASPMVGIRCAQDRNVGERKKEEYEAALAQAAADAAAELNAVSN